MSENPAPRDDFHILVKFGRGFAAHQDAQGEVMLALEKWLREKGIPAEVYKETRPDDSKVRQLMTLEKRGNL